MNIFIKSTGGRSCVSGLVCSLHFAAGARLFAARPQAGRWPGEATRREQGPRGYARLGNRPEEEACEAY